MGAHFFNLEAFWRVRLLLLQGALGTAKLALVALALALSVGLVVFAAQLGPWRILRRAAEWFIDLMRAFPVLVFLVFRRLTAATWRSAFVAALFGLHPMHVESVAWVAERKDVLSTFFFLLTLWAYVRYMESKVQSPKPKVSDPKSKAERRESRSDRSESKAQSPKSKDWSSCQQK